ASPSGTPRPSRSTTTYGSRAGARRPFAAVPRDTATSSGPDRDACGLIAGVACGDARVHRRAVLGARGEERVEARAKGGVLRVARRDRRVRREEALLRSSRHEEAILRGVDALIAMQLELRAERR